MPKKKTLLMIFPLSPIAEEFRGLLSAEYEILITDDEEDGLQILIVILIKRTSQQCSKRKIFPSA